jgi:hypothetical protein
LTVSGVEQFPGELADLRADNARLRRLLQLSEAQAQAAANNQATLVGAPESPVGMSFSRADKVRFYFDLFRCGTDIYAVRWENRRDGRSGWVQAIKGYWRKGMSRAEAPYLPLTPEVAVERIERRLDLLVPPPPAIFPFSSAAPGKNDHCRPSPATPTSGIRSSPTPMPIGARASCRRAGYGRWQGR